MFATTKLFKPEIDKTKQFIKKHKTVVACAATAAITLKLSHERNLVKYGRVILAMGDELEVAKLQNIVLRQFVDNQGLKDEFLHEFIPSL